MMDIILPRPKPLISDVRRSEASPRRIRPGFRDNNGRCCGTAGALALACDRQVERGDGRDFADILVADLAARATTDANGLRWSNAEHRQTPSDLAPATSWAMGNAGITRELLRHAHITANRSTPSPSRTTYPLPECQTERRRPKALHADSRTANALIRQLS
ncbi:hypothetical protein ACFYT4_27005 [Streptomyces sp. NPDC004609]|uniref:hypothetical protein n=1 Tax=Streptomyces sp. NPDC004609 TaxID=3364704 RepID=UPI0036BE9B04